MVEKQQYNWKRILILTLILLSIGGGVFTLAWAKQLYGYLGSHDWVVVEARLMYAKIGTHVSKNSQTRQTTIEYYPIANYEYTFLGKKYVGSRVMWVEQFGGEHFLSIAENLKYRYETNRRINIYVDPGDPNNSVVYRDIRWWNVFVLMVASSVWWMACGGIVYVVRKRNA